MSELANVRNWAVAFYSASLRGAKRRGNPEAGDGLLRCARNDGAWATASEKPLPEREGLGWVRLKRAIHSPHTSTPPPPPFQGGEHRAAAPRVLAGRAERHPGARPPGSPRPRLHNRISSVRLAAESGVDGARRALSHRSSRRSAALAPHAPTPLFCTLRSRQLRQLRSTDPQRRAGAEKAREPASSTGPAPPKVSSCGARP